MALLEDLKNKKEKISVTGLGYVGLPLAIELAKKYSVVGYDLNKNKLKKYINGIDVTNEVGNEVLKKTSIEFTNKENNLGSCKFHIVAVPTPINSDKTPNLKPVILATEAVGRNLSKGSIVVYESTVYPGTTEEICIPVLEEISGLKYGVDFKVGYSPERINPGDKVNTLTKIIKIVSGSDREALKVISGVYDSIIEAGVFEAESIKVAEAAKVIENSQRDINIAFMNELAMVFDKMDIDTSAVLEAASTKWNFLKFSPGLVGGHCIGVDPYYFTYKAEQLGYHSQIILSGRKINDDMGKFISDAIIKKMIQKKQDIDGARIAILGLTFKEDVSDIRNSKVVDVIKELEEYGIKPKIYDPHANKKEVYEQFNLNLIDREELKDLDVIVFAVPHKELLDFFTLEKINQLYRNKKKILFDIKSVFDRKQVEAKGFSYWSL